MLAKYQHLGTLLKVPKPLHKKLTGFSGFEHISEHCVLRLVVRKARLLDFYEIPSTLTDCNFVENYPFGKFRHVN